MKTIITTLFVCWFIFSAGAQEVTSSIEKEGILEVKLKKEVENIIASYVEDYKSDRHASEKRIIGIEVPEVNGTWTVQISGKKTKEKDWDVSLEEGFPKIPTYAYRIEFNTLKACLLYTSPSPRDKRQSRMPSSA